MIFPFNVDATEVKISELIQKGMLSQTYHFVSCLHLVTCHLKGFHEKKYEGTFLY